MNKQQTNKRINKQTGKQVIRNDIRKQLDEYNNEQRLIRSISYCPCICCDDDFLPITLPDDVPDELLCHVITRNSA
jgi:hypothetical protein